MKEKFHQDMQLSLDDLPPGDTEAQRTDITRIRYPVLEFPKTIKSHNFDKQAIVEGTLTGIKGQYLMFDTGVINIRKFASYQVRVSD